MTTLTTKQHRAIEALLTHTRAVEAARESGVSRVTLWRWMGDETFCNELKKREAEILAGSSRRLASLTAEALDTLSDALNEPTLKPAIKLRAAEIALSKYAALKDAFAFEARLDALEKEINAHR